MLAYVPVVSFPFPNAREGNENYERAKHGAGQAIPHFFPVFCSPQARALLFRSQLQLSG